MGADINARAFECTGLVLDDGNSSSAQRARILAALRQGPVTTFDARKRLDVPHPAGRVMELRKAGHEIATFWINDLSEVGKKHRVARYVLRAPRAENAAVSR
jgi:hypothetical protein